MPSKEALDLVDQFLDCKGVASVFGFIHAQSSNDRANLIQNNHPRLYVVLTGKVMTSLGYAHQETKLPGSHQLLTPLETAKFFRLRSDRPLEEKRQPLGKFLAGMSLPHGLNIRKERSRRVVEETHIYTVSSDTEKISDLIEALSGDALKQSLRLNSKSQTRIAGQELDRLVLRSRGTPLEMDERYKIVFTVPENSPLAGRNLPPHIFDTAPFTSHSFAEALRIIASEVLANNLQLRTTEHTHFFP